MKSFSQIAARIAPKNESKPTTEWQELGKEIQEHYKKPLYWLIAPWKEQIWYVRQVFKECKTNEKPVNYFIAILKLKHVKTGTSGGNENTLQEGEPPGTPTETKAGLLVTH